MGTYIAGVGLVNAAGSRLITKPSTHMTQRDQTKNQANIRDVELARELLRQGTPGTPYTAAEIQARNQILNKAEKIVMDEHRADKTHTNRQTESQASIKVPGDDRITFKTGANLKEHRASRDRYAKFMKNRDKAAAKGDKRRVTFWSNKMRSEMERHIGKNNVAGDASMIASTFFAVDRLQGDFKTYGNLLSRISKASKQGTAFTKRNSQYNKAITALLKKDAFKSESNNLPKFIKYGLAAARKYQRAGFKNTKTKNKQATALNKLFSNLGTTVSKTNAVLESQRRAITLKARKQGIPHEGVSRQRLTSYTKRHAAQVNNAVRARKSDPDHVRAAKIEQAYQVWTRRNKREALAAFRKGQIKYKQV